tara:strand:- start:83 stop:613 length:531 start_codon:yes stop_codon:yes gene_type:complete
MNTISKSNVFAENKLFATVDTTIRKVVVNNLPFLLGDTVGFIRKLPTQLIESFKSTLDEVREADLLLHVVDISHNNFKDHMESVNKTLKEINVINKPTILIFNKIDRLIPKSKIYDSEKHIKKMKKTWISKIENITIFISAKNKLNLDEFKNVIYNEIKKIHIKRFPYNDFLYPNI